MIHLFNVPHWHHRLNAADNVELRELYTSLALRYLAYSLVNIFVPIYLFQLGFSFQWVMVYFIITFAIQVPLDFVAGRLTAKYGAKHTMVIGYALLGLFLLALIGLEYWPITWGLIGAALLAGGERSLFFVAYHIDFSQVKDKSDTGREVGVKYIIVTVSSALGPLIGGLLAFYYGLALVLVISTGLLLLALRSLFQTGEPLKQHRVDYSWQGLKDNLPSVLHWSAAQVDLSVAQALWPFFLFFTVFVDNQYLGIGVVTSIALIFSIATDYWIGKNSDHHQVRFLPRLGALASAVIHVARQFATSALRVVGFNIATELANAAYSIPLNRQIYLEADRASRIEFIVYIELISELARIVLFGAVLAASFWLPPAAALTLGFLLAAAMVAPLTLTLPRSVERAR